MKTTILFIMAISLSISAQNAPKVGLVLSGGGAKGFAHIAVLKELEQAGVQIDYIGGTSMGAVIGGLYAAGYSADQIDSLAQKINLNDLIFNFKDRKNLPLFDKTYSEDYILEIPFDNFKLNLPNAISSTNAPYLMMSELLINTHDTQDFSKLTIPFYCVATNLETGKEKIFHKGFLPKTIMASAALPSVLQPIQIQDSLYVDGGVVNNFPAKEMRNLHMDIVIGVELGQGLKSKEEIKNVADILTQISNFSIKEGVKTQLEFVDVLINPNLKEYSPTSFTEYDSIYHRGELAAKKLRPVFDSISKLQKSKKNPTIRFLENPSTYCLSKIEISGDDRFNSDYVKGKVGFDSNEEITPSELTAGMLNLLQTKNYQDADYQLIPNSEGYELKISLVENKNKLSARIGAHYDKVFKTGILLNITHRSFIFNNTFASFDVVLGDRFRYFLNIFGDNGLRPSVGVQSSYMNIPLSLNSSNSTVNYINYNFNWFHNDVYVQSTLKDKYALGFGLDHDYAKIESNALSSSNPDRTLVNAFYLSPKSYLRVDTQDNPNFPTSGLSFYGLAKYTFLSNQSDFIPTLQLSGDLNVSFSFAQYFTLQQEVYMAIQGNNNSFVFNSFFGGINQQKILYFKPFMGYNFGSFYGENALMLRTNFQVRIFKNNFIIFTGNVANITDAIEDLRFFKYEKTGLGVSYGYDSPVGPISLSYGYSPQIKKNIINFSLGYWF